MSWGQEEGALPLRLHCTGVGNLQTYLESDLINMLPSPCLYGLEQDGFVLALQVK